MAEMWKPKDLETLRHWHDTIADEASDKLTEWETEFITSVGKKLDFSMTLTQRQEEILERIYAEKTS